MGYEQYVQVVIECDRCNALLDGIYDDEYDADENARRNDWSIDIEVSGGSSSLHHYEHLCDSCTENDLHYCTMCDTAVWCEDSYHCDDVACSTECNDHIHEDWGRDNPGDASCIECGWENPYRGVEANAKGEWSLV